MGAAAELLIPVKLVHCVWTSLHTLRSANMSQVRHRGTVLPFCFAATLFSAVGVGVADSPYQPQLSQAPLLQQREPAHTEAAVPPSPAAVTAEPSPQQVVGPADTSSEEPLARVYSPRILAPGIADTYSLRTFAQFDRWRDLSGDARAYEVYRYLTDTHTGLFHMNVVAEGEDALSEFVEIRDPVKILNVYGYAYCGILGPTMAGICEGIGLGPARTVVLPGWNHVAAETYYDNQWHYLDLDVHAVFRRDDGRLASLEEARTDPSLWRDRGPLFFPNDPLDSTRAIYEKTTVEPYYGFQQAGHTMDYVLRPGERLTRWWRPQGGRWHHLAEYNDQPWLRRLLEEPPRGPKPNHRQFTVHNHGNGRFIYEPQLTDAYADFEHGVEDHSNVMVTSDGLRLRQPGNGVAVFEVRSPYIIVPQVGELDRREDDTQAAILEWSGRHVSWSISRDNGLTWLPVEAREEQTGDGASATIDLTRWVSGRYGYLLRCTLSGNAGDACLRRLKITTWVQLAPASLPALRRGRNAMRLVTGDHYGLSTRVVEVRSRASDPEELRKYLVAPPEDYDPAPRPRGYGGPSLSRWLRHQERGSRGLPRPVSSLPINWRPPPRPETAWRMPSAMPRNLRRSMRPMFRRTRTIGTTTPHAKWCWTCPPMCCGCVIREIRHSTTSRFMLIASPHALSSRYRWK